MYALIKNGIIEKYPYSKTDLQIDNPNISFADNMSVSDMKDLGVEVVYFTTPPEISSLQILEEQTPVFNEQDQRWEQVWSVKDLSADEIQARNEAQAQSVRTDRDQRLAASDWTQIADSSADKNAWIQYRKELRDLPEKEGFPWDIKWPDQPK